MSDAASRLRVALADRYAIQRELGAGGMATVYLAEDLKHRRQVAVKVLRPELAAVLGPDRFLREIEIAARLQHPHILPLFDSGHASGFLYYVMPYVEGESLRGRLVREGALPIAEAARILRDVADALAHAHARGVVHRDIKPENVMLSGRHALVTDFGVAKAVSEASGRQQLTTAGVALGTPAYMAPEQAAADPNMDHRVDVYALGVVAYELLTGRPPFEGGSPQETLAAHVTKAPQPVSTHRATVPPAMAQLVMKCLEKRPADRCQKADELVGQLEGFTTSSGGITPTDTRPIAVGAMFSGRNVLFLALAVILASLVLLSVRGSFSGGKLEVERVALLPLKDQVGDSSGGFLAEGLTREVISALTRGGIRVIGFTSVSAYAGKDVPVQKVAEDLRVDAVAIGSLRRSGQRVQLMLELTDPQTLENIWAGDFSASLDEMPWLAIQVANGLSKAINTSTKEAPRKAGPRVAAEAFNAYSLGWHYLGLFTIEGFRRSAEEFQRAIVLEPTFAAAYAGLAVTYEIDAAYYGSMPKAEAHRRAEIAIGEAFARDRDLPVGYLAKAMLLSQRDWDWAGAEAAFKRSIDLEPSAWAYDLYAWGLLLPRGRIVEGVESMERAVESEPMSAPLRSDLGGAYSWARRYPESFEQRRIAKALSPGFAEPYLGDAENFVQTGKFEEAFRAIDVYDSLAGGTWPHKRALIYARAGRTSEAQAMVERLEERFGRGDLIRPSWIAITYAALDDRDRSLAWVKRAIQAKDFLSPGDPFWGSAWTDPRFKELLRKLGLEK